MIINETVFNTDCLTILNELQQQLQINKIPLLQTIKDTPDNVMVACPYHKGGQERRPSMGVRKSDGLCHCFTCATSVGLPQMISYCFGDNSIVGAFGWQWLVKNFLTVAVENRKPLNLDFSREHKKKEVEYVSEEELDSYRYTHPYMYKRRLTDPVIELFDIGYDQKTDCITFPIRDMQGRCLFVARRSVKTKFFNYPSKAEKPLYGLYEYHKVKDQAVPDLPVRGDSSGLEWGNAVIVCESMLDALTAWGYGKPALALNGLGTELQFKQLRSLPCRKIILATDADSAG